VRLAVADGGLRLCGPKVSDDLPNELSARQAEVTAAIADKVPFDPAEADRVLAHLRAELTRIRQQRHAGTWPEALKHLEEDSIAICEGYVSNWQWEVGHGWDPMEMLQGGVRLALKRAHGSASGE
jgi:hypothetical protein